MSFCSETRGRHPDWTPRLSRNLREFEQVVMEWYRTEYMFDGTSRSPSKSD